MRILLPILLLGLLSFPTPVAHAQVPVWNAFQGESKPAQPGEAKPLAEEIAQKKALNSQALEALHGPGKEETAQPFGSAGEVELREDLNGVYEQITEALQTPSELEKAKTSIDESREQWRSRKEMNGKASFFQLDDLTTERMMQKGKVDSLTKGVQVDQNLLEEAKEVFEEKERERRQAKEKSDLNRDPAETDALKSSLEISELQSQIAEAKIVFLQADLKNLKLEKEIAELKLGLTEEKIRWLSQKARFTKAELDEKLGQLREEENTLKRAIESLKQQLASLQKVSPETAPSTPAPDGTVSLEETVGLLEKKHLQIRIKILSSRLSRLRNIEELWRHRFRTFNEKVPVSKLSEWAEYNRQTVDQIRRAETSVYGNLSELRKEINKVHEKIRFLSSEDEKSKTLLFAQKDLFEKILFVYQESLTGLSRDRQAFEKFQAELEPKVKTLSWKERFSLGWEKVQWVWNYELTSIDDKPITVKKLVLVLILLLLGMRIARRISHLLGDKIFPRLRVEAGVAAGLTTLTFYLLLFLVSLLILYIVNVPLTMFTVLGGALAIGVGFGSQNIVKNFICGLILLMERPIKIGDMVQLDDATGVVERIGARSTILRAFSNFQIIVPNSDFLEKKVTNWTLTDDLTRTSVGVGVAYGSPTRDVVKLLHKSVEEHGLVLKTPEPLVLFSDFGDNALKFEIHFWIRMRTMLDRKKVESDIRIRIDSLFQESGIEIAFPQRDVRLEAVKPLEIRVIQEEKKD